ncbi:Ala-tRNA(Pro) hydrolase [Planktotalea frisia]|jgi:misacylated tRNA(Ala) deacylase|uniref:Alanine--tRNA ligase n=1 Tax=Planktotalea frisia TaxID=696762 RepID=A0A1L9NRM1_9RHOB|nr:alanyl-tRNA editing protein [Planktotalea frisia]MDB9707854.1 alanyl-tRNA editing protein [Planktotalea frisia]OJI91881.1 alanine--tRNA ligase [Planktotalea frisia]PZX32990.1 Ala-tRNA(Pro) hydrolase [Planktotalea frisia]
MTHPLFLDDAYMRDADATVVEHTPEGGVVLDRSIFYPTGGGQPGDSGMIMWDGQSLPIATSVKIKDRADTTSALVPAEPARLPPIGAKITQTLDWERRHAHMRVHTALHLLSVVIPLPVSGGSITAAKGRLDFDMPDALEDKDALERSLNALIELDYVVSEGWISDEELRANMDLVKTMSVQPPMGAGRVRLVRIGDDVRQIDLQPCGGTHVARTSEIGRVRLGKVEKKGKQNRRVYLHLDS